MSRTETFETTLGDLIVVLTEETTRVVRDEQDAYRLVALILKDLLQNVGSPGSTTWH